MQTLKEEVRERLVNEACEEFLQHGFEKASLRKIVKEAGTTIGNFYNYFQSKEELFYTITTPMHDNLVYLLRNHNDHDDLDLSHFVNMGMDYMRSIVEGMIRGYINQYSKTFVILIDGSKGTRYENVKEELIELMTEHFREHLAQTKSFDVSKMNPDVPRVIAVSFLEGILFILRGKMTQEEKNKLIIDYIIYFAFGFVQIIEKSIQ